jgi:hypothetical protein
MKNVNEASHDRADLAAEPMGIGNTCRAAVCKPKNSTRNSANYGSDCSNRCDSSMSSEGETKESRFANRRSDVPLLRARNTLRCVDATPHAASRERAMKSFRSALAHRMNTS